MMVEQQIEKRGIKDPAILKAMLHVPREKFVPEPYRDLSYIDRPLPIGLGQTISQPYIVAYMAQHLELNKNSRILEIGTGCGYNAAVLSRIAKEVYSVEILKELFTETQLRLSRLGYNNVHMKLGDGHKGWMEHAPYDAIVFTAATSHIPEALFTQLKPNGIILAPVGGEFGQVLTKIRQTAEGEITEQRISPVRFVRMTQ